ncbi:peroxidase-related enzyme [Neptunomonas japonica]|uniref:Alkylhydroperoxidase n=1 Tax=Neptunomonas japonica JAMM 1380 TaxID=1441457 RepID=A0A7R6PAW5_9GAMM|nr:peroxidase-related enzyme [Neptunomonas japonica]BBB30408.1 alkylhydroperoxidase [Neptunomonas japonica JAMM 1380]
MKDLSISRYPVPSLDSLPDDIRERILAVQEKARFIPNVFLTLAHRPAEFRAFFAYHDAIMEREGSTLSPAEKEMIIVATSAANGCQYCVVAHGALLRVFAKEPLLADQIAVNYLHAPISERQKAMLAFSLKLSRTPELVQDSDYEALNAQGFDDEDILDITGITAFFGLSNRMAIVTNMQANTEFYTMAREPRA